MLADVNDTTRALDRAEEARREVSPTLDPKRRSEFGQFMTPATVASFMAGLFVDLPDSIRLLDAGAGMGALTAAFVDHVCGLDQPPTALDVTAFEVDPGPICSKPSGRTRRQVSVIFTPSTGRLSRKLLGRAGCSLVMPDSRLTG